MTYKVLPDGSVEIVKGEKKTVKVVNIEMERTVSGPAPIVKDKVIKRHSIGFTKLRKTGKRKKNPSLTGEKVKKRLKKECDEIFDKLAKERGE